MIEKTRKECIECNLCRKNCLFLDKYKIHLKDFTYREDLRNHCFLCNKCQAVCPKDLSGAEISMEQRKKDPDPSFWIPFLKDPYKFRNQSNKESETLLYFGCNYPGYYPETCKRLIELARERGVDFSVDCCKKPVIDLGIETTFTSLEDLLKQKKTKRLICVCPNCYHLLKKTLSISVINIFQWIREENLGKPIKEKVHLFFPCSDRYKREIFEDIKFFLNEYNESYDRVNCCGLGGNAVKKDPDIIEKTNKELNSLQKENIYTYCSSCSGIFRTYGLSNIKNLLSEILGVHEEVSDTYAKNILYYMMKKRGKLCNLKKE